MKNVRGKHVTILGAGAGLVTLVVCAVCFKDLLVEQYHLYRLKHGTPKDRRLAAETLAGLGSVDSVPEILRALIREGAGATPHLDRVVRSGAQLDLSKANPLARAVLRIGRPGILKAITHENEEVRQAAGAFLILSLLQQSGSFSSLFEDLEGKDPRTLVAAGLQLNQVINSDLFPDAIEVFRDALKSDDEDTRFVAALALGLQKIDISDVTRSVSRLAWKLESAGREERKRIAEEIGKLGPVADGVLALMGLLSDGDAEVRMAAVRALGELKAKEAVPALVARLSDEEEDRAVKGHAALSLGSIGAADESALSVLSELLESDDDHLSGCASIALAQIGAPAVPALMKGLECGRISRMSRYRITSALGDIGAPAVPVLVDALDEEDAEVRGDVQSILADIGAPAIPRLCEALRHESQRVRVGAVDTLRWIRPLGEPSVRALAEAVRGDDVEAGSRAVRILGGIGKAAIPALRDLAGDEDLRARRLIWGAIRSMRQPYAESLVPSLMEALRTEAVEEKRRVAEALASAGLKGGEALVEALEANDRDVRKAAIYGLSTADGIAEISVPALTALLKSGDPEMRRHAARAVGRLGPAAQAARPALRVAQDDEDARLRQAAARALLLVDPLGSLVEMLESDSRDERRDALEGLDSIPTRYGFARCVPPLIDIVKKDSGRVRLRAISILGKLAPLAEDSITSTLQEMVTDEDPPMREAARRALNKIRGK